MEKTYVQKPNVEIPPRRRAASNYQHLDRCSRLDVQADVDQNDNERVFRLIQRKFGFQEGNVQNQREHYTCWVQNYTLRYGIECEPIQRMQTKFFANYKRWCAFLHTTPHLDDMGPMVQSQIILYLLIWGESANLRFMPECLCFIYHSLAPQLNLMHTIEDAAPNHFLHSVIAPIYNLLKPMQHNHNSNSDHVPLEYTKVSNYDDLNEFFWKPNCLQLDVYQVSQFIQSQDIKTFREKRSYLSPFLAFFRIYFFLFVMLHTLVAIAYISYSSNPDSHKGLAFYANFFEEDYTDIRRHSLSSILISFCGLLTVKVILEVWNGGLQLFVQSLHVVALYTRLMWHTLFFGIFLCIQFAPHEKFLQSTFLNNAVIMAIIYLCPVTILAVIRMLGGNRSLFESHPILTRFDGACTQYIGRSSQMKQPLSSFLKYALFWAVLYTLKLIFNLQLMIKPLMGPSVEIFQISVDSTRNGLVQSNHNALFIFAMWIPAILVYIYDSQIWLVILQSIVGVFIGLQAKIRHSSRRKEFVTTLQSAVSQFDLKIVSDKAKRSSNDSKLRFAVVWNEIISSFRLSDLLDDRETAILQYQINEGGTMDDPVFLLAGQVQIAIDIVGKTRFDHVRKELETRNVFTCAQNCVNLSISILRTILKQEDAQILESLVHQMKNSQMTNLSQVQFVKDAFIELLTNILDLPEPSLVSSNKHSGSTTLLLPETNVHQVRQSLHSVFRALEPLFPTQTESLQHCSFETPHLADLIASPRETNLSQSMHARQESFLSHCTRLYFLLTLDVADSLPRCFEARRRMSFFLNSLSMDIPTIASIESMRSFSVITPYYNEPVLYSIEELEQRAHANPLFSSVEKKERNLSILKYLITFHSDEWGNFLERVNATNIEEALSLTPTQVRLWASMRGQTLARTVHGIMLYEDALKMLLWLEIGSDASLNQVDKIERMESIAGLKFSYITSCQNYAAQRASCDSRAQDIDLLMRKYPNWRVSYVDRVNDGFDCVLIKAEQEEIVEVYRYTLPGDPILGEGKPENQNIALVFSRGEYLQTIDMNQEHYFEECLKIPNFLATNDAETAVLLGMKEHIFTGRASSLANFMTLQELVFVSLTQRVLANPLCSRMHYGHPDVFDKAFVMTNGGVSKASRGINLSEDVFSGYNAALRGGSVTHVEFMQCGKGRDVTLSQINAFEAKLSNGSAEASLSREASRMGRGMDFFRLHSTFYGHMGFYICNLLTVFCVFCYAYSKLYISLFPDIQRGVIIKTKSLDDLAAVLNTQFIFQFGMLMTIPLLATLFVEFGWRQAVLQMIELICTLGPVFYIFETGTKAHFFDVAMMRGGSKYRGTGRGFAIVRETLVSFFHEYAASHYRKAVELLGIMILFGLYGDFSIGTGTLNGYCADMKISKADCNVKNPKIPDNISLLHAYGSKGQDYGIASFAVWLLGVCWLLAPFLFNTDGFDMNKTRVDIKNFIGWMMAETESPSIPFHASETREDSWLVFWKYETDLIKNLSVTSRIVYAIRKSRHILCAYYVFMFHFRVPELTVLLAAIAAYACILYLASLCSGCLCKDRLTTIRGCIYYVVAYGGAVLMAFILGFIRNYSASQSVSFAIGLLIGMYSLLQYVLVFHGAFGVSLTQFRLVQSVAFFYDMLVGLFLVLPLLLLSAIPFVKTLQTRMMYNGGFSRALSSDSEFAASISILIGLCAGFPSGYYTALIFSMGYVNNSADHFVNESFLYFVNNGLKGGFDLKMLKVYAATASAMFVVIGVLMSHYTGRKNGMRGGVMMTLLGAMLVLGNSELLIICGVCVSAGGVAVLSVSALMYNFEICMDGWRGKGVVLVLVGSAMGYLVESAVLYQQNARTLRRNWQNKPFHDWQYEFLYAIPVLIILVAVLFGLPESPVWLLQHRDRKATEAALVKLRQRRDVSEELDELERVLHKNQAGETERATRIKEYNCPPVHNLYFRLCIVLLLQAAYAILSSSVLFQRIKIKRDGKDTNGAVGSRWMVYFGIMNLSGVILSLMSVDNVRRKTILKDILPFTAFLSIACGTLAITGNDRSTLSSILLFVLFASATLSITCATWLTAIEIFPLHAQARFIALSFSFYYLIQAMLYILSPSFALSHFAFAGLCILITIILFSVCASSKTGAIELKSEKAARKLAALRMQEDDDDVTCAIRASRSRSYLRSRRHDSRVSSRYVGNACTPSAAVNYENYESPIAKHQNAQVKAV